MNFDIGQLVLLSSRNLKLSGPCKLQDRWVGPFSVTERIGNAAYQLDLTGTSRQALRNVHNVFHVSLLRPCFNSGVHADV